MVITCGKTFKLSTLQMFEQYFIYQFIEIKNWKILVRLLIITGLTCSSFIVNAQAFITTWKTTDAKITIPTTGVGYNYNIIWTNLTNIGIGDGSANAITGNYTITGLENGDTYEVEITGAFPRIFFNNSGDKDKIQSVEAWGNNAWTNMGNAFHGCTNLTVSAIDAPNLLSTLSLQEMFRGASSFNESIDHWDVSGIVSFFGMFLDASSFNKPLNSWALSSAVDISNMFNGASNFNQPLDNWATTGVTGLKLIFKNAVSFNQPVNHFDVSLVMDFSGVFEGAIAFDQPLDNWVTSSATNMALMFHAASSFNQPVANWDVSNVTSMAYMFANTTVFNQDLGNWDIGLVTDMTDMLRNSNLTTLKYDNTLIGWSTIDAGESQIPINIISFRADGLSYCHSESERQSLIDLGWVISFDSKGCVPFRTTWETTDGTITIPTVGGGYDYDIVWTNLTSAGTGDGAIIGVTGNHVITGLTNGHTYQIEITGDFPRIFFNNGGDKDKILSVEAWGDIVWGSMNAAFFGCTNLSVPATDAPILTGAISLQNMFRGASIMNEPMGHWDVSKIISFYGMFIDATSFNQPLNSWVMTSAVDISHMFNGATNYNQPLTSWVTTGITDIKLMFKNATNFNQPVNHFDVSLVMDFAGTFEGAIAFDQPLDNWVTSSATSMALMFNNASSFNQPVASWDVSNVTSMAYMFANTTSFNQELGTWDIGLVTDMTDMLWNSSLSTLNYDNTLIGWSTIDVGESQIPINIISFRALSLSYCNSEAERQSLIDLGWVISLDAKNCVPFTTTWQTTIANETITIPTTGTGYNYTIDWGDGNIDTGVTGDAAHIYTSANTYTVTITGDFPRIFFNNNGDKDKILSVETWGDIVWTSMNGAFFGCTNLTVSAVDAPNLTNVVSLNQMFRGATSFSEPIDHWDVSKIISFYGMFWDATSFNQPLNSWVLTSAVDISHLFNGATNYNQPLTSWVTTGITDIKLMFKNATNFNQPVNHFDVSLVMDFAGTFEGATAFDQPVDNWVTSSATSMALMFNNASSFNQAVGSWDVSNVTSMAYMFANASVFDQDLGNWDVGLVTDMADMLWSSSLSITNYDNTLIGWSTIGVGESQVPNGILSFRAQGLSYCNSTVERQSLIDLGWVISLDSKSELCEPITQASNINFSNISSTQIDVSWTNGNGTNRILVVHEGSVVDANPSDLSTYTASSVFGDGSQIGVGNFVVYTGTSNTMTFTGFTAGSTYHFRVYEYNGTAGTENYLISTSTINPSSLSLLPEINVFAGLDNTAQSIADAQAVSIDFGSSLVGSSNTRTFAIENTGTSVLTISSISASGIDYIVTSAIATIGVGITETFTVTLSSALVGTFNSTITIINDDANENPFIFDITGVISAILVPEINVFAGVDNTAPSIVDAQTISIDFGSALVGSPITQTFAIENTGTSTLTISSISTSGIDFSVTSAVTAIGVGITQTFTVTLSGASVGGFNSTLTIASDDADENPFTFELIGLIEGVNVIEGNDNNGVVILLNEEVDLGSTVVNEDIDKVFVIENLSSANALIINSVISDNPLFEVIDVPSSIPPTEFAQFTVRMIALEAGMHQGVISVSTNIKDFIFGISGEVLEGDQRTLTIYNVVTPNGDNIHDFLKIVNIENYPGNLVIVYNRWGDKVFEKQGYDNINDVFTGATNKGSTDDLVSGNYYYSIDKGDGKDIETGFLFLKR